MYYQCGVGVVEVEVVGYYGGQFSVCWFGDDVQVGSLFVEFFNVDVWCDKVVFQYQQGVDGFLYVCCVQ